MTKKVVKKSYKKSNGNKVNKKTTVKSSGEKIVTINYLRDDGTAKVVLYKYDAEGNLLQRKVSDTAK